MFEIVLQHFRLALEIHKAILISLRPTGYTKLEFHHSGDRGIFKKDPKTYDVRLEVNRLSSSETFLTTTRKPAPQPETGALPTVHTLSDDTKEHLLFLSKHVQQIIVMHTEILSASGAFLATLDFLGYNKHKVQSESTHTHTRTHTHTHTPRPAQVLVFQAEALFACKEGGMNSFAMSPLGGRLSLPMHAHCMQLYRFIQKCIPQQDMWEVANTQNIEIWGGDDCFKLTMLVICLKTPCW